MKILMELIIILATVGIFCTLHKGGKVFLKYLWCFYILRFNVWILTRVVAFITLIQITDEDYRKWLNRITLIMDWYLNYVRKVTDVN